MIFTKKNSDDLNKLDKIISDLNSLHLKKDGHYATWGFISEVDRDLFKINFGKINKYATCSFVFLTVEEVEQFLSTLDFQNLYQSIQRH